MDEFVECREAIERIKDRISLDIRGKVFDWHVADELNIPYSTLRINIMKNRLPLKEIAKYCYRNKINLNEVVFTNINKI